MLDHLKKAAEEVGLPLGARDRTYNSRLAQEMGKWAESRGIGDEFHHATFKAYFVDGSNIANIDTLVELGVGLGLPAVEIQDVLEKRTFKGDVDADWSRSRQMGISAVPTFMLNRQTLVGAQSYESLSNLLTANNVGLRSMLDDSSALS